jgi:hypothetical protein
VSEFKYVDRGISAKAIYKYYKAQNKLTMCYQAFAKYMRKKYGSILVTLATRFGIIKLPIAFEPLLAVGCLILLPFSALFT